MHDEFSTPRTKEEKIDSLVHLYMDGAFGRRDLIRRLARYTGGAAGAAVLLEQRGLAQTVQQSCPEDIKVPVDAPDIEAKDVQFPGKAGALYGHLAKPKGMTGPLPGILVIHENRGLVPHIEDVTRRVARAGLVGCSVDLLSRQGGARSFANDVDRGTAYGRTVPAERLEDLLSAIEYMKSEGSIMPDKIGAVGFCAGGGHVLLLAYTTEDMKVGVPYYGTPPNPLPNATELKAKQMLFILSENDRNQNSRYPELLTGMISQQKNFGMHLYQGTNHGFHNDTSPIYDAAAACDAWAKTMAFFKRHLNSE